MFVSQTDSVNFTNITYTNTFGLKRERSEARNPVLVMAYVGLALSEEKGTVSTGMSLLLQMSRSPISSVVSYDRYFGTMLVGGFTMFHIFSVPQYLG